MNVSEELLLKLVETNQINAQETEKIHGRINLLLDKIERGELQYIKLEKQVSSTREILFISLFAIMMTFIGMPDKLMGILKFIQSIKKF